jgi:hypothetical protein
MFTAAVDPERTWLERAPMVRTFITIQKFAILRTCDNSDGMANLMGEETKCLKANCTLKALGDFRIDLIRDGLQIVWKRSISWKSW